jgi:hypothetical protein
MKARRIMAPGGIAFAASQFVFAEYSGAPFSNRAFNLRLRAACRALGVGEITRHGLRHSAATILLNHMRKDLREIQELLRHKNIRTTVRYTHVGYEQDPANRRGAQPGFGVNFDRFRAGLKNRKSTFAFSVIAACSWIQAVRRRWHTRAGETAALTPL